MENKKLYSLGEKYLMEGDYENAIKEFKSEKERTMMKNLDYERNVGHPYLAFMYYYGIGTNVDYEKAWEESHKQVLYGTWTLEWTEKVIDNTIAKFIVAKMLYNGIYVEKDLEKGMRLFKSIADEWKIEETIANTYAFKMLLEDYKDIDAQNLVRLIHINSDKYKDSKDRNQSLYGNQYTLEEKRLLEEADNQLTELEKNYEY